MSVTFVLDCNDPDTLAGFWTEALHYERGPDSGSYVVLMPGDTGGPMLILQRVDEPKVGKNRMHLDIHTHDLEGELGRLETLGARRLSSEPTEEAGFCWVVLADPEGNEFCVCRPPSGARPADEE